MTFFPPAITDEEVKAAMRAFEQFSTVLRYREAEKWHVNDVQGMRKALEAAASVRRAAEQQAEASSPWSRAWASSAAGLCMCLACVEARGEMQVTMHLCPLCANKRCPKADNHAFRCTGSNEIGQTGELEATSTSVANVSRSLREMPAARRDLDRMAEAIRALPGSPTMGRAIGDGR